MVMAFVASAEAENKVTIDNFNIKVDEEKTISVYLENSDPMVGLQMDFKLPKGLDFVPNSVQRDEVRLSRSSHSIYMNEVQRYQDSAPSHSTQWGVQYCRRPRCRGLFQSKGK